MKNLHLILFLLLSCGFVDAQKLGFSTFSPLGGSHDATGTLLYNVGEPIISRVEGTDITISQGVLNADRTTVTNDARIQVRFFLDDNEDGYKNFDERFIDYGQFETRTGERYLVIDQEGVSFNAPAGGGYRFTYVPTDEQFLLTTDSEFTFNVDDSSQHISVSFGLKPNADFSDATVYLTGGRFRCGRTVDYELSLRNTGLVDIMDTIYLSIDQRIDTIYYRTPPDIIVDDHTVGWVFDLEIWEREELHFTIKAPIVTDPSQLDQIFKLRTWINYNTGWSKEKCLQPRLRCSYDPNDKLVYPNREDSLALIDEELVYTIRFQNTGNDYADDVVVIDTLQEDLDLKTFRLINTSHPDQLEVIFPDTDEKIIKFQFKIFFYQTVRRMSRAVMDISSSV